MLPSAIAGPVWASLIWISYAALIFVALWCTAAAFRAPTRFRAWAYALAGGTSAGLAVRFALIFAGFISP